MIIDLVVTQGGQNGFTLGDAATRDEVTRGIGQVKHSDDDNDTEDNLEGNWETPDQVIRAIVGTKVDPVGNHRTDGNDTTFDTDEQTTVARLRAFRLVGRNGRSVHTIANASDDTANEELQQGDMLHEAGYLDGNANNHDNRTGKDHPATTHVVTVNESKNGTPQDIPIRKRQ